MLSKIKEASPAGLDAAQSDLDEPSSPAASESDSNNNTQSKNLEAEQKHGAPEEHREGAENYKRTQEELIDIVENSRKRRLSKDSADSLTSFIRYSFLDHQHQLHTGNNNNSRPMANPADLLALAGARQVSGTNTNKRARMPLLFNSISSSVHQRPMKNSSYLGNVVERLHHQHQQQQQQQQQHQQTASEAADLGLSFQLQQFLAQQQHSLEDGNQLVLAAAIQQALTEQQQRSNSSTSSANAAAAAAAMAALNQQQQRHVQQHRHTQAAAALSALASAAGSQQQHNNHHQHHLQHHHIQQQQQQSLNLNVSTANGHHIPNHLSQLHQSIASTNQHHSSAHRAALANGTPLASVANPLVDFKCETCGSSFDDRHRLMQHQSIHLELKREWFTETPVDEVMKIFNRRRGEFLCNTCNLRFEATLDYDNHNHQVHGQRPYCCQFCGNGTRTFKCWRQYLNHLYDHRYIFSCTIGDCDFTVNRRDSLRFHIFRFHLNCQLQANTNRKSSSSASSASPSSSPTSSSSNGHNMLTAIQAQQQQQQAAAAAAAAAAFNLNLLTSQQFNEHFGAQSASSLQQQAAKWQQQQQHHLRGYQVDRDEEDDDTDNDMNVAD